MRFSSRFADISVDLGAGAPTGRYSQALSPLPSPVVTAGVPIGGGDGDESVMLPCLTAVVRCMADSRWL